MTINDKRNTIVWNKDDIKKPNINEISTPVVLIIKICIPYLYASTISPLIALSLSNFDKIISDNFSTKRPQPMIFTLIIMLSLYFLQKCVLFYIIL